MTINLQKDDFLIPDHSTPVKQDVSALLGYGLVKPSKKLPIEFDQQTGQKLAKAHYTSASLTKNIIDPNWTNNSKVKPTGVYLGRSNLNNVILKAPNRSGLLIKYLNPLLDVFSRQTKQPNVIISLNAGQTTSLANTFESILKKRNYQTNTDDHHRYSLLYLDLMPLAFEYYYLNDQTKFEQLSSQIAACILNNMPTKQKTAQDVITQSVFNLLFQIITSFYFDSIIAKLQTKHNLQYSDFAKQATLAKTINFFTNKLTKIIFTKKEVIDLLARYHLRPISPLTEIGYTLFDVVLILKSLVDPDDNRLELLHGYFVSQETLTTLAKAFANQLKRNLTNLLVNNCSVNDDASFIPDLIASSLGQTLTLKLKSKYWHNYSIAVSQSSQKTKQTYQLNQNYYLQIPLTDFNIQQPLTIELTNQTDHTMISEQITLNQSLTNSKIIKQMIWHLDDRPFVLFNTVWPYNMQNKQYNIDIINILYQTLTDFMPVKMQRSFKNISQFDGKTDQDSKNFTMQAWYHVLDRTFKTAGQINYQLAINNNSNMMTQNQLINWQNTIVVTDFNHLPLNIIEQLKLTNSITLNLISSHFATDRNTVLYQDYWRLPYWTPNTMIVAPISVKPANLKQISQLARQDSSKNRSQHLLNALLLSAADQE